MNIFSNDDDFYCLGYNTAGHILHVTTGTKELCQSTAKQIRSKYKSVRVVPYDKGRELLQEDRDSYFRQIREMEEAMI